MTVYKSIIANRPYIFGLLDKVHDSYRFIYSINSQKLVEDHI